MMETFILMFVSDPRWRREEAMAIAKKNAEEQ